jgi:hypothetical protein
MKTKLVIAPETNMEIAYDRYYEIVTKGLNNMHPDEVLHFTKSGGEILVVKSGVDDLPYFMALSEGYGIEKSRLRLDGNKVFASEIIDAGYTLSDMLHFLPDALALSAVCTAGKAHKFRGGYREGAGRKPTHPLLKKAPISLKLPQWLLQWLDQQTVSRAVIIENALRATHDIEPPSCRPIDA